MRNQSASRLTPDPERVRWIIELTEQHGFCMMMHALNLEARSAEQILEASLILEKLARIFWKPNNAS